MRLCGQGFEIKRKCRKEKRADTEMMRSDIVSEEAVETEPEEE